MYTETLIRVLELTGRMAWDTWWALVLGLTISGAVEVFVSEDRLTSLLGDDDWQSVSLGAVFGVASSSCSYSAVGTTKTLFKKGASAAASLGAFMFASTDLVVELGLALWVLLGWQFVVGEYLGGVVAVAVMAVIFRRVVPEAWVTAAREHLRTTDESVCETCDATVDPDEDDVLVAEVDGRAEYFCCSGCRQVARSRGRGGQLLSTAGWRSAASATMKDWEMIWRDLAFGFVVAGVVGAAVPQSWWTALFGSQGTFVGVLTNAVIAVVIGVLTFMCSVGNVPFALVLWRNGLPFGGVLAFVYADLIIPPLVNLYRRYYGTRMAATLFASLFVAAVVAGVVVHYVMNWAGLVPTQGVVGGTLADEYTTVLNLVFTPVFAGQVLATYGRDGVERRARAGVDAIRGWYDAALVASSVGYFLVAVSLVRLYEGLAALAARVGTAVGRARNGLPTVAGPSVRTHDRDGAASQTGGLWPWLLERPGGPAVATASARLWSGVVRLGEIVQSLGRIAWLLVRYVLIRASNARIIERIRE